MRIRRRPQPSFSPSPSPSFLQQQPSDPSTSAAPQTPGNAPAATNQERLEGGGEDGKPPHLHASADLGQKSAVARRLALPQEDNAGGSVERQGAERGADEFQRSLQVNGHRGADRKDDVTWTGGISGGERAAKGRDGALPVRNNGTAVAVMLALKDEKNGGGAGAGASASAGGGAKKRRGPAVLLEGSRCSRVNGRGWRCSQPTLVGYSLCEHHLGKGRTRSASASTAGIGGRGGVGQLGRTEHRAAMPVVAATATAKAEQPDLRRY